ncbi:hypothetical protein [Micromonospora sp. NPDC048839]|uniref:hypothetical protein n=1 Tax=Micromonospora sp. NPDC048839 TaxID=3155641 RepID=UPI0033F56C4D
MGQALKAFHTLQKKERLKAGNAYNDSGYVLVNELGQPQRTDWLRRRVYELMTKVGVGKVRPYDARHACLTYLAGDKNGAHECRSMPWITDSSTYGNPVRYRARFRGSSSASHAKKSGRILVLHDHQWPQPPVGRPSGQRCWGVRCLPDQRRHRREPAAHQSLASGRRHRGGGARVRVACRRSRA